MKKRLFLVALAALFAAALSLQAQEENINLGKKYGNYEVKLTKDKWTSDIPVTAIWDNATGVWVTAPKIKNKEGSLFLLPKTTYLDVFLNRLYTSYVSQSRGI